MMCDNQYNFAYPWNNSFYQRYLQEHAALSYHFQKMHSIVTCGIPYSNIYDSVNICDPVDCCSSCCSCSSGSSSKTSSTDYDEVEEMYNEEGEEQYDDEDFEDGESESEYEFNVDCILAMRAAKDELKKKEELSESKDESENKSDSKSDCDSIVLVESDKDEFELIDLSSTKMLDFKLSKSVGKFNKTEEEATRKRIREYLYGEKGSTIAAMETAMALNFEQLCDKHQPSLWPVLPLRL